MMSIQRFAKPVSLGLAVLMLLICVPFHGVLAALIPTAAIAQTESGQAARDTINALIDRQDVQAALTGQGLSPQEARERVAALTDAEAVRLAGMLDELPAGGSSAIGFLVAVILVVFLVLLITDLTGMTDVFPWVK